MELDPHKEQWRQVTKDWFAQSHIPRQTRVSSSITLRSCAATRTGWTRSFVGYITS